MQLQFNAKLGCQLSDFHSSAIVSNLIKYPGKAQMATVSIARMAFSNVLNARTGISPLTYILFSSNKQLLTILGLQLNERL
jgi:hypothetical protein